MAYENRFDAALSVYLLALSEVAQPEMVSKAATAVLRTPKCWASAGLARELLLTAVDEAASSPLVMEIL